MLKQLAYTSALASTLSIALIPQAQATNYVISGPSTTAYTLLGGDTLTVTSTGSIGSPGFVYFTNTNQIGFITNNGTINAGGSAAITSQSTAGIAGALTNTGTIRGSYGIIFSGTGGDIGGGINNSGTIQGTTQEGIYLAGASGRITGGITNSGTIQGQTMGIRLQSGYGVDSITNTASGLINGGTNGLTLNSSATITGGINNSGTISGNMRGISITSASHVTGGITNSGTVSGGTEGIYLYISGASVDTIINTGTISGGSANGIRVDEGSTSGLINNSGTISGGTNGIALTTSGSITGGINNSGTIRGTTQDAIFLSGVSGHITGGITNSGTLRGQSMGIRMESGYGVDNITNTASGQIISNTLDGIFVTQSSSVSGDITNNGTITAGRQGITVWNNSTVGNITNTGSITANGGSGMDLSAATVSGSITNSGTITGSGIGINVISGSTIGSINNSGTITGSTGVNLNSSGNSIAGGITNSGTIRGTAGDGISLGGVSTYSGAMINNGTIQGSVNGLIIQGEAEIASITNNSNARIIGGTGAGVYVGYSSAIIQGALTNHGTISGQQGVFIGGGTNARITGITNTGTIQGISEGVNLNNGRIVGTLNNSGSIIATAGDAISLNGSQSSSISGSITNSGTIRGSNYGIYLGNDNTSIITGGITNSGTIQGDSGTAIRIDTLNAPLPITLNGGRVIGDIVDSTFTSNGTPTTVSGNFATEGNITVSSLTVNSGKNFTLSSGNTVTLNQMGASTGGTFTFGVNNSSAGGYGKLVTSGAGQGLNLSGATVAVNYTGGALSDGDQFRIGQGNVAITGGPGAALTSVTDNSVLWDFKIANGTVASTPTTNRDLFLFVSRNNNVSYSTPNNAAATQNILSIGSSSDSSFSSVISNVNSAPTTAALNQRAEATLPPLDAATYLIAQSSSATSFNQAGNRLTTLASNGASGVAAGDTPQGRHVWIEGFGQAVTQGLRSGIAGYTASTGGLTFGADTDKLHPDAVVGASISFANTDVRADNANATKTQISSNRLTLYGGYDLGDSYFARGMAAYAYDSIDSTRFAIGGVGGINASGSYNANQYAARAELGREFSMNHLSITPALRSNYLYYDPTNYTETGAGGAGLHVTQKGLQTLEVGPTINVKQDYTLEDGSRLTPELRAGYQYAMVNDDISSLASFTGGGGTITATGATPANSRYSTGFGVTYTASDTWKFKADVDYQYRSDFHATSGVLRASYNF